MIGIDNNCTNNNNNATFKTRFHSILSNVASPNKKRRIFNDNILTKIFF